MAIGSAVPVAILRDAPLRSGAPQDEVALFFTRSLAGNDKPGSKNLGTDDAMLAKSAEPQTHDRPSWFAAGMPHIWLPYAQMKIAGDPLPVVATRCSRIVLADGRDPNDGMHHAFGGWLPRHLFCDLPRDEEAFAQLAGVVARHADEIAGIIVEPLVQGAGGMLFHDVDVLERLRRLADRHQVLLIFDEIFTGFGRTGAMFASAAVAPA